VVQELLMSMSASVLTSARDRAHSIGASTIVVESRDGNVAQAIIDFAKEKDVDAIVVGKQGSGTVASILLGGTSQKLVNLAPCVVVIVP
jgi:nucleotide-binding universal stress UspA family protein